MFRHFFTLFFVTLFFSLSNGQTTLIPSNSNWKFLDNGSDQGNLWTAISFNDASWTSGNAELGYGDGDENTTVSYGADANNKYITTYFRKTFNVTNPGLFSFLTIDLVRDDGAVVYINGIEVFRSNMPGGNINYLTLASNTIAWPFEDDWHSFNVGASILTSGTNVIAVEVHQDDNSSSDISFNLSLTGNTTPLNANVVRGPYLQKATENSVVVKWRTDIATDSKVSFGLTSGLLNMQNTNSVFSTEHEVELTGLSPATNYFYNVGSANQVQLQSPDFSFKTHPIFGTEAKYRFWAIGDAGMGNNDQRKVRDAFLSVNNGEHIDGWIMLGDNAYESGFDNEYQNGVFQNMYEPILSKTVLWPAPGNHDYNNHIPFSPAPAYYDIFTLPANGESGGIPSGTEKYYSYDLGNIHFITLDSYDESRSSSGAMATWLQADLAANTLPWIIAYWHHPPYTKGSHDSDDDFFNGELVEIRENILPILENYGVDLVLNGHSHSYERTNLIDGHYGYSTSLQSSMILDGGSGNSAVACPYQKKTISDPSHKGTVYAVVGCSGKLSGTSTGWPHPAMYESTNAVLGSMLIEVENNRLDAKFIASDSTVYDQFTIIKNAGKHYEINACNGDVIYLKPSWPGDVTWFPGNSTADSLEVTALLPTTYFAHDTWNCITDTFTINILTAPPCISTVEVAEIMKPDNWKIFPSSSVSGGVISISSSVPITSEIQFSLFTASGSLVNENFIFSQMNDNVIHLNTTSLAAGLYLVSIYDGEKNINLRFILQ